jgi:hypothetical protein
MDRRLIWFFLFGLILSVLCLAWHTSAQQPRTAQEDKIREALVRYQIANWDLRADVYFVQIQSKDPDKDFLHRFADVSKPVRGKSASREKKDIAGFHVEERRTKKRGVVFDQGSITWKNDSTVELEGGYVCASLCMASGIYHLRRRDGRWSVTEFEIRIQS